MFWRLSAISLSLVAVDVGARTQSGGAPAHLDYLPPSASLPTSSQAAMANHGEGGHRW